MSPEIQTGDRVVVTTTRWGDFHAVVVEIAFGKYVKVKSLQDEKTYGVLLKSCRPLNRK